MKTKAHITSRGGLLFAQCSGVETCLSDWGLERKYGFGEEVELDGEPCDGCELADMLDAAR